jgi:two-component system cell cycle response regulator
MTQATPMTPAAKSIRRFVLEMRGFSDAEKNMLASTFRLTGRREISYVEPTDGESRTDIYLINADNPDALNELLKRDIGAPNAHSPAVVIGRVPVETPWPFVAKPIHWMRLFENLDGEMQRALRERSARNTVLENWDGATLRRSSDQKNTTSLDVVETPARETVLVVDDSATVRAFMRIKLSPFQFDVDFAETGEQAVEKAIAKAAAVKPYNCIFLDIMMPGIDGYEVCKQIKSNSNTKQSAVVMLTSKSSIIDKLRANWSGCDAFLSKPVGEDDLLATIAKFLPSARESRKD